MLKIVVMKERKVKIFGKELSFDLPSEADESVFDEIFRDGEYRIVDSIIAKAKTIFDVGAHIGLFSVYASLLSDAKITAFEPSVENFALMKENLKRNGVRDVVCKNVAVGAEAGEREFFLSEDSHNHSFYGEGDSVKVRVSQLKRGCDFLKMDCEGAEFEILPSLDLSLFGAIFVEYHREPSSLVALLGKNFSVKKFPSNYDKNMGYLLAT
ncbi:FkbM family methyltransferase [Candidatus Gracilibacteria bacterium]|nr:FkbM family methyltransferase [Candidatus Gracilibacteria bacterium]